MPNRQKKCSNLLLVILQRAIHCFFLFVFHFSKLFVLVISEFTPIFGNLTPTFGTHTLSSSILDNFEAAPDSVSNSALESMQIRYSS